MPVGRSGSESRAADVAGQSQSRDRTGCRATTSTPLRPTLDSAVFDGLDVAEISRCTVELATEGLAPGHRHPSLQSRATWSRRSAPATRCGRRKHLPNSLSNVPAAPQFLLWDFSCHP